MPESAWQDLATWARANWPGGDPGPLTAEPIAPDGSVRLFLRASAAGRSLVALANPANPPENRAWLYFAQRLAGLGLPVAPVLASDLDRGRFLMEDLGRRSLQEAVQAAPDQEAVFTLYQPVLAMLARLQARGAEELDLTVCFDGPELTPEFLRQREAGYFIEEFVMGWRGLAAEDLPAGLDGELARVCQEAGGATPRGLVHRDFQSRNIIYEDARLGLVDFQGARLGPAQYDLAALLHDPYVNLDWGLRLRLKDAYVRHRRELGAFDQDAFEQGWPFVSLSRVMQALGAYGFLTRQKNKPHFAAYIAPALATLERLTREPALAGYPALASLAESLRARQKA